MRCDRRGFTLIETMLAVLLLAILASAAAFTFSQPIAAARFDEAISQIRAFDASARTAAIASRSNVRVIFDLSANRIERHEEPEIESARYAVALPPGCKLDSIRIGGESTSLGTAPLEISAMGLSHTYAIHLIGPSNNQWLLFAGLSGDLTKLTDEASVRQILEGEAAH